MNSKKYSSNRKSKKLESKKQPAKQKKLGKLEKRLWRKPNSSLNKSKSQPTSLPSAIWSKLKTRNSSTTNTNSTWSN